MLGDYLEVKNKVRNFNARLTAKKFQKNEMNYYFNIFIYFLINIY